MRAPRLAGRPGRAATANQATPARQTWPLSTPILRRQTLVTRLEVEAGWYAVLRVPGLSRKRRQRSICYWNGGVVVHPGGFYGFPGRGGWW